MGLGDFNVVVSELYLKSFEFNLLLLYYLKREVQNDEFYSLECKIRDLWYLVVSQFYRKKKKRVEDDEGEVREQLERENVS